MKFEELLTSMLKERENPEVIFESCIGEVIEAPPNLTISIWSGEIILNSDLLYMNDILFNDYTRSYKLNGTINSIEIETTSSNGEVGPGPHKHPHGKIIGKGKYETSGTIINTCTLKKGDLVKVTPVKNAQKWIVDFKIRELVKK